MQLAYTFVFSLQVTYYILRCLKWKFKIIVHSIFMIPRCGYVIYSKISASSGENVRGTPRCPKLSLPGLFPNQPNHYSAHLFAVLNFSSKLRIYFFLFRPMGSIGLLYAPEFNFLP
jgi:hypothetical protein